MQLSETQKKRAKALLARWRDDPAAFAREALGIEPWSRQRDVFAAVASRPRVVTRSGHKVSKSCSIGCLALWWVCTRPRAKVVLSSTVADQLKNILWPELKRLHENARVPIGGKLAGDYHGGLWFADGRAVIALKSEDTKPEAFAGISSPHLLYLIDEASGFPEALLEAAQGNVAGGGRIAAFGNPTRTSGWFFDAFHTRRDEWFPLHIDSRESPNITGAEPPIPGLATAEWEALMAKSGRESPIYQVRVAGTFPKSGDLVVVGLGLLEESLARDPSTLRDGPMRLGLDVGRTGDDPSVLAAVRGDRCFPLRQTTNREGDDLAGWVLEQLREMRRDGVLELSAKPECRIDVIGVGASAYDHLKYSRELVAIPVNVARSPMDPTRFCTARDEVWFAGAEWLDEGGVPPADDTELHGELTAARYKFDGKGRYDVASKDEMKKALRRSPNKADALNLAVYRGGDVPIAADAAAKLTQRARQIIRLGSR